MANTTEPRPFRVVHVTQAVGGVASSIDLIMRYVDRTQFELSLICPTEGYLVKKAESLGFRVFPLEMERNPGLHDLKHLREIIRIIGELKADVIHCHSAKAGVLGRLAGLLTRTPVVYSPRAFSFLSQRGLFRFIYRLIEWSLIPLTTVLHACSQSEKQVAKRDLGFREKRIAAINNAVEFDLLLEQVKDLEPGEKVFTVMTIGRIGYQKNHDMFVRVAELVHEQNPSIQFILNGGSYLSPDEDRIKQLVRARGLESVFTFIPWMEKADTLSTLAGSDVFVLTSRFEGLPNTIMEAMALKRPVIATDVDGSRDLVLEGETGYLVSLDDDRAMANHILELASNPDRCGEMGKKGQDRIKGEFSIRITAPQFEDLYRSLAK